MRSPILAPIVALVAWSLVMQVWLYATRIPAMRAAKTPLDPTRPPGELMATLPPNVRWKADNYNHLMEQPTIFYAVALALALMDFGGGLNLMIAWAYVALRIVHSLVQATVNKIVVRFSVFMLASLCLLALTLHAGLHLLYHGG
ncbi:MAPEG family protein [Sphingomonas tabacisoli]|uniref:MAPEG family protein n=1 Tax=Sphingomonas tabacisoli TaxID=2249466 RepID=A0ABW4I3T2_9SPHN